MPSIEVHKSFLFQAADKTKTFFEQGIHEVEDYIANHSWTRLHATLVDTQPVTEDQPKTSRKRRTVNEL